MRFRLYDACVRRSLCNRAIVLLASLLGAAASAHGSLVNGHRLATTPSKSAPLCTPSTDDAMALFGGNGDSGRSVAIVLPPDLPAEFRTAVTAAVADWTEACPAKGYPHMPRLEVTAASQGDPASEVVFDYRPNDAREDGVLAFWYPPTHANVLTVYGACLSPGGVSYCDFSSHIVWTTSKARTLLEHELGHVLGLGHDLTEPAGCRPGLMTDFIEDVGELHKGYCEASEKESSQALYIVSGTVSGLQDSGLTIWARWTDAKGEHAETTAVLQPTGAAPAPWSTTRTLPKDAHVALEALPPNPFLVCATAPSAVTIQSDVGGVNISCQCTAPFLPGHCMDPITALYETPIEHQDYCSFCENSGVSGGWGTVWWWLTQVGGTTCSPSIFECTGSDPNQPQQPCTVKYECSAKASGVASLTEHGPELGISGVTRDANGLVTLEGWAADDSGVPHLDFFLNGDPATLVSLERGLATPSQCGSTIGGLCPPSSGYRVRVSTSPLLQNPILEIFGTDGHLPYGFPTPLKITLPAAGSLAPQCSSTLGITLAAPTEGSTVAGIVTPTWSVQPPTEPVAVALEVDGHLGVFATSGPSWDSRSVADGTHTLQVKAQDRCGRVVASAINTVRVQNAPLCTNFGVSLSTPTDRSIVRGLVSLGWFVSPASVSVFTATEIDGVAGAWTAAPPTWDSRTVSDGWHTVRLLARDQCGQVVSSAARTYEVINTADVTGPQVWIAQPVAGATLSGGNVPVSGWATDRSRVVGVDILIDGTPVSQSSPLQYGLSRPDVCAAYPGDANCPNVGWTAAIDVTRISSAVPHVLQVVAHDTFGNATTISRAVSVVNQVGTLSSLEIPVSADAYVRQGSPTTNFGAAAFLQIRTTAAGIGARSFLQFDLRSIAGSVVSAKLRLHVNDAPISQLTVMRTDSNWTESTVTWNSAPTLGPIVAQASGLNPQTSYDVDVTSAVQLGAINAFALASDQDGWYLQFGSKESSAAPTLLVTWTQ